jgi:hypothetical protein
MSMTLQTADGGQQQQCPPAPPSSPAESQQRIADDGSPSQYQQQHQHFNHPLPQQQIANLLQFAQTSYTTNPTDALSALMEALTLSTGTNVAALHAMDRIRSELGNVVAECVVAGSSRSSRNGSSANGTSFHCTTTQTMEQFSMRHQVDTNQQQQQLPQHESSSLASPLSTIEMTQRAMTIVQEMLNDTSTILYAQGRQYLLQQAMEDGSSIVCSNCGDMISRERWRQHAEYWCRGLVTEECYAEEDEEEGMEL